MRPKGLTGTRLLCHTAECSLCMTIVCPAEEAQVTMATVVDVGERALGRPMHPRKLLSFLTVLLHYALYFIAYISAYSAAEVLKTLLY